MARRHGRGDRFRLVIYGRMWQRWALPCALTIPASFALWWFAPRIPILHAPYRALALVPASVAIVILVYAYLARQLAWVQCRPGHVRIQTLLYPLAVSYGRVRGIRPRLFAEVFNPAEEEPARRDWLRPYWRRTALAVQLSEYPLSGAWLRLWLSPYLFNPDGAGFVLLVEDWMALSRQIDESRVAWEMRRTQRRQPTQSGRFR